MVKNYFKLLTKRNFLLLWSGQIISQFGDRLTQIALIGLVSKVSTSSSQLAFVMSLSIIPVFIISPISGVYIDRWDKRKTMFFSDLLRGLCILLIPLFIVKFTSLIPVYCLIFISFIAGRFFIPAKMAFVPEICNKQEIFMANSLISITATIAAILGFGIGGIIVERWKVVAAFHLDAATFLLSALAIFFITVHKKGDFTAGDILSIGKDMLKNVKSSFTSEFKEGIRYIKNAKETKYAFKIFFFLFSYLGCLYVVFIRFIQNTLSTITKDLGLVAVSLAIGLFFGSLVYGKIAHKFSVKKTINFSVLFSSFFIIFFAAFLKLYPVTMYALFLAFILGAIISPVFVGVNSLIHEKSDKNLLGRIFSGLEIISHLGFLITMYICSFLADIFTPFTIIISVGILGVCFSIFFILSND